MRLFDLLFSKDDARTGYAGDSAEYLRALPDHASFSGGAKAPVDWSQYAPRFRWQESTMMCTAFAACSAAAMLERRESGREVEFSPLELFVRADGQAYGNSLQNTESALRNGLVEEASCPWPGPVTDWDPCVLRILGAYAAARAPAPRPAYAVKGLTRVMPEHGAIQAALADSPVLAIVDVGRGYFDDPAPAAASGAAHAVVIVRAEPDGRLRVFDSLTQSASFDGFHWLSKDFPVLYAFGILDLPDAWRELQEAVQKGQGPVAAFRYGKDEDRGREALVSAALREARSKNPTCAAYLDARWGTYLNAVTYGGFTVQDVLNETTSIRRGQGSLFNFDQQKA